MFLLLYNVNYCRDVVHIHYTISVDVAFLRIGLFQCYACKAVAKDWGAITPGDGCILDLVRFYQASFVGITLDCVSLDQCPSNRAGTGKDTRLDSGRCWKNNLCSLLIATANIQVLGIVQGI